MELSKFAQLAVLGAAIGLASPAFAQNDQKPAAGAQDKGGDAKGADKADAKGGDGKDDGKGGPGPMSAEAPATPQPEWVKICNTDEKAKKEVCLTSRDLRAETGQTVASIAVRVVQGENKKFLLAAVPPGLLLVPGVRVAVDQNQPVNGRYSICFPNACYAEVEIPESFFNNLKKGKNLVVQAMNQQGKTLNFPLSLDGFAKSYDGAPVDPKAVAEYQKEMNEGMNRLAEEQRNKLKVPNTPVPPADGGPNMSGGKGVGPGGPVNEAK